MENNEEEKKVQVEKYNNSNLNNYNNYNTQGYMYGNYDNFNKNEDNKLKKEVQGLKIFILLLILVGALAFAWIVIKPEIKNIKKTESKDNSDVELKYTETTDAKSEGTYIIDVSEVVENVMPSIVAITSKTLVSSGNYGPSYWGGKQYATGAGSGIIVSKSDKELLILTNKHVIEDA